MLTVCLAVSQPPGHYGPVGLAEGTVSMHLLHSSPFTADGMEGAGPGLTVRLARCEKACRGGTVPQSPGGWWREAGQVTDAPGGVFLSA